jgi:general secretion pathway protein D
VPIGNGGTTIAYEISTRNANTLLELRDGETQVLAGLITDSDSLSSNHIPGLGDMPIIGKLFGSDNKQRNKSEIVLAITPRIIRGQSRPPSETTEFYYGTESQTRSAPFAMPVAATSAPAAGAAAASGAAPTMSGGVFPMSGASSEPASLAGPHAAPTVIDSSAAQPLATAATAASVVASGEGGSGSAPAAVGGASTPAGAPATPGASSANGAEPLAGAPTPEPPAPDAKPKVTLEGPDAAKVGDDISVSVKLASGQALGRVRAQVRYDAAALKLTSADPGDLVPSGDSPKVETRPGGVQIEIAGSADAPVSGNGSIIDMHFHVLAPRAAASLDTQVVLLGEDGTVMAATPATSLKMALSPP